MTDSPASPAARGRGGASEALAEVGVDIGAAKPKPIDHEPVRDVDVVVILGMEAHVEPVDGTEFLI